MKVTCDLLSSFDQSWTAFSTAWKKARRNPSERSIHALRVSSRRLLASIELLRAMSGAKEISNLRRDVKGVLKTLGPLRDVQVEIQHASQLEPTASLARFQRTLERRESRRLKVIDQLFERCGKRHLTAEVKSARDVASQLQQEFRQSDVIASLNRVLRMRRNEFLAAKKGLTAFDEEDLHRVRLAAKKLRYAQEAVGLIVGGSAKRKGPQVAALQQTLGEIRDIQLLSRSMNTWAVKRGEEEGIESTLATLRKQLTTLKRKVRSLTKTTGRRLAKSDVLAVEQTIAAPAPKPAEESERASDNASDGKEAILSLETQS
jgi:CHAD domain-containing protein